MRYLSFILIVVAMASVRATAEAGVLISDFVRPVSVSASSEYPYSDRKAVNTINGSGLNASGQHGTTGTGEMWMNSSGTTGWIEYDLGTPLLLSGFHLWNFNMLVGVTPYTDRGIKDAEVLTSLDGVNWSSAAGSYSPFMEATGLPTYAGEDYSFAHPTPARYVKIDGQNTHGGDYLGLSETRFTTPNRISDITATASSVYSGRVGQRAVDDSGMTGFGLERADTDFFSTMWMGYTGTDTTITFDLQDVHPLQAVRVWNFNGAGLTDRGIETLDIAVSLDGSSYQTLAGPSSGHFSLSEAPGALEYLTADMVDLGGVFARYVRFTGFTTHGDPTYVGLSEVRFYEAVPEPSTLVMLLGLAATAPLAYIRRRRKK